MLIGARKGSLGKSSFLLCWSTFIFLGPISHFFLFPLHFRYSFPLSSQSYRTRSSLKRASISLSLSLAAFKIRAEWPSNANGREIKSNIRHIHKWSCQRIYSLLTTSPHGRKWIFRLNQKRNKKVSHFGRCELKIRTHICGKRVSLDAWRIRICPKNQDICDRQRVNCFFPLWAIDSKEQKLKQFPQMFALNK